ncbi:hypothetical protein DIE12_37175 [Burkholderia sp. Bp9015]|nr:hypothetical protein DIE20_34945 [Burkholderia sp. Bp9131]RQR60196.1 hypothetical protein DIE12_37175 [Burkholderia sp. Bp9015]RQR71258.1 hypothetical protein DIE10_34960 [Burkholderia sp. Bp9011]
MRFLFNQRIASASPEFGQERGQLISLCGIKCEYAYPLIRRPLIQQRNRCFAPDMGQFDTEIENALLTIGTPR